MFRKLLGAALALAMFAGVLRADEVRVKVFPDNPSVKQPAKPGEPIQLELQLLQKDGKPGAPIKWQFLQKDGKPAEVKPQQQSSNAELIALLKKAIQILEAQGGQPAPKSPIQFERRLGPKGFPEMAKRLQEAQPRIKDAPPKGESPELAKARAEYQAAEARLQQAKEALAKLQGGQPDGKPKSRIFVVPQPKDAQPAKPADVEKRLERLMQELEELRKEIKSKRP